MGSSVQINNKNGNEQSTVLSPFLPPDSRSLEPLEDEWAEPVGGSAKRGLERSSLQWRVVNNRLDSATTHLQTSLHVMELNCFI